MFGGILCAGEIDLHTLLVHGHVAAQAVTGSILLLLQTIEATTY